MAIVVTMTGGSPWGFKMKGGKDFHQPLAIGKVTSGGKASRSGVVEGYIIEKVNGEDFANLGHHEAQNKIKSAGTTLTMHLSKPKPSATPAPAPYSSTVPDQPNPSAVAYKPGESRYGKYDDPGNWQKEGQIQQSKAMTKAIYKAPVRSEEKKTITFTPEIKEMLEEAEKEKEVAPPSMKASEVRTWPAPNNSNGIAPAAPTPAAAPAANGETDRSKAIGNIGKFFQGSAAPRYGEPTFAKALQDIASPLGDPAVLEVRLGSNMPTPSVHWYHNNKPARESKEKDIRFLSNGPIHTLVLGELSPELLGTYTCTIMNKYGSKSSRCHVTVKTDGEDHYQAPRPNFIAPSNVKDSKRVVASTSLGLYSSQNAKDTYQGQMRQSPTKEDGEESEVLKALRDDAPQRRGQTRSMKFLEESLLPESDDL